MRLEHERIKHHTEECQCEQCGSPRYVGDVVYFTEDGLVYCSRACATLHQFDATWGNGGTATTT